VPLLLLVALFACAAARALLGRQQICQPIILPRRWMLAHR
jgi:hypothetical protein